MVGEPRLVNGPLLVPIPATLGSDHETLWNREQRQRVNLPDYVSPRGGGSPVPSRRATGLVALGGHRARGSWPVGQRTAVGTADGSARGSL